MERETGIFLVLGFAAIVALIFVIVRFFGDSEPTPAQGPGFSDTPLPDERIRLLVRGWNEQELLAIAGHFCGMYDVEVGIGRLDGDVFSAAFPEGISPRHLAFLVNDLAYPDELEPGTRDIRVLARFSLCAEFGIPHNGLKDCKASLYVPAGDDEFDLVCLQLESGEAFRIPFTDMRWHPVGDARWPAKLDELARMER